MSIFNTIVYWIGSITTLVSIVVCLVLFFAYKSKNSKGERIELENKTTEKPWALGTWIAGVFVAGTGVALMYAPGDLVGYIDEGLNPIESITMVSLLNGAPVWALYSIMGLWYMKHMDSKIGKLAAILSTVLGMSISLWTGMNTVTRFIGYNFPGLKFLLAAITVGIAMISAKRNLLKGMSKLAFLIFVFAFLAVLSTPFTDFSFSPIEGKITGTFWKEYFFGATAASWIFWFLSWTPTVSRWLAHISKGRTMKEYIAGTMVLPTALAAVWMSVSWMYQDVIMNFNLAENISSFIPCVIFIISGILFMTGTLDSDCKVFTEDLQYLSKGKLNRNAMIPYYGLFVLFFFSLFISGIIKQPFAFNEYSSLIFMPLMVWSLAECVKSLLNKKG
ncbi:MAG: BCCT family transporter [Mogibacterium sp.]|nr:BCCT family transporter [Mogibacterium sp.]